MLLREQVMARGELLRRLGLTPTRTFHRLKREFPKAEWDELHKAAELGPTGITPLWAAIGRPPLCPVSTRRDPREVARIMGTFRKPVFERELREAYERNRAERKRVEEELMRKALESALADIRAIEEADWNDQYGVTDEEAAEAKAQLAELKDFL